MCCKEVLKSGALVTFAEAQIRVECLAGCRGSLREGRQDIGVPSLRVFNLRGLTWGEVSKQDPGHLSKDTRQSQGGEHFFQSADHEIAKVTGDPGSLQESEKQTCIGLTWNVKVCTLKPIRVWRVEPALSLCKVCLKLLYVFILSKKLFFQCHKLQ